MKKKLLILALAMGFLFFPATDVSAETNASNVAYAEATPEQLEDEEWLKKNDPEYGKYQYIPETTGVSNGKFKTTAQGLNATDISEINWGDGLTSDPKFGKYGARWGVDVSKWQGKINWQQVKASGVDFAIIRLGARSLADGTLFLDTQYLNNIQGAHDAGLEIGIYFFSQAINEEELIAEAEYVDEHLSKYKSYLSFPVFYDLEWDTTSRVGKMKSKMTAAAWKEYNTNAAIIFGEKLNELGYKTGIYGSKNNYETMTDMATIENTDLFIWLARYTKNYNASSKPYTGEYKMWQYSDGSSHDGAVIVQKVPGISASVDLDIYYDTSVSKVDSLTVKENGNNYVKLAWRNRSDATGYVVEEYDGDGNYIGAIETSTNSVTIENLASSSDYKFRVMKVNEDGDFSDFHSAFTRPDKVFNLRKAAASESTITLKWDPVARADGYKIYRYEPYSNEYVGIGYSDGPEFTVTGIKPDTEYSFYIGAFKWYKGSRYTGEKSDILSTIVSSSVDEVLPPEKAYFSSFTATTSSITLKWNPFEGATSYLIYLYDPATGQDNLIGNVADTSFTVNDLSPARVYYFRLQAVKNQDGNEYYGEIGEATETATSPGNVTGLKQSARTASTVKLTWKSVSGATGYRVYKYTSAGKFVSAFNTSTNSATVKNLTPGKYKFNVRAYVETTSGNAFSGYCSLITAYTNAGSVTGLKMSKRATTTATITWKKSTGATGYTVYKYNTKTKKYVALGSTANTSYTVKSLSKTGTYQIRVAAYVLNGKTKYYGSQSSVLKIGKYK